jgi:hypothetical protein
MLSDWQRQDLLREVPKEFHRYILHYEWLDLHSLLEALTVTRGRTVKDVVAWEADPQCWMYCKSGAIQTFEDGTALVLVMDSGWEGTEITTGTPASTSYYFLTPT